MKWFLIFWAGPILFLGSWYGLSYYDINFGLFFFSRKLHDLVFQVYGNILGIPPETIPPLVARAIALDTLLVLALLAFRRRRAIRAWWAARQSRKPALARESEDSLSSAP